MIRRIRQLFKKRKLRQVPMVTEQQAYNFLAGVMHSMALDDPEMQKRAFAAADEFLRQCRTRGTWADHAL